MSEDFYGAIPDMPDFSEGDVLKDAIIDAARLLADAFAKNDILGIMLKVGDVAYHVRMYDIWRAKNEHPSDS